MTTKSQLQQAFSTIDNQEPIVILYHSRCPDGMVAMDILRKHFPNSISLPLNPNNLPLDEEINGMTVISVDLFQKDENIEYICSLAEHLYYIDHHPRPKPFYEDHINLTIIHTLEHSAAGIVSLILEDTPAFVCNLIEPNDLGRFNDVSHEDNMMYNGWYNRYWKQGDLTSAITVLRWGMDGTHPTLRTGLIKEGEVLKLERDEYFESRMPTVQVRNIHGHEIAFCRSDRDKATLANYIRDRVCQDIICVWGWGKEDKFYVSSWRSTKTDMNTFLRELGGGGHANACGLKIPVGEEKRLLGEELPRHTLFTKRNALYALACSVSFLLGAYSTRAITTSSKDTTDTIYTTPIVQL